jgi:hypothetical protein
MTAGIGGGHTRGANSGILLPALMALLGVVADTHSEPERCGNQVGVIWFRTRMLHTQRARICRLMISEPAMRPCKNRFSRAMDCPVLRNTRVPKDAEALLHANVLKARNARASGKPISPYRATQVLSTDRSYAFVCRSSCTTGSFLQECEDSLL